MDVEAGIERLFGLAPEEFVAARDELARRLRKDGDGAAAKRVAGLRRPTVAAWAVNRAARRRPELVTDLIEAGERLRQAQRRALSGLRGGALRTAGAERRVAIERLLAEAADVLEESGRSPEAHRDAIAATLQAASVDETAAAAVRAGTLDREVAAPSGFGEVAGRVADEAREAADTARTRSQRAARRARDAAEEAVDAETAAETAQQALGQAERRVTELESGD